MVLAFPSAATKCSLHKGTMFNPDQLVLATFIWLLHPTLLSSFATWYFSATNYHKCSTFTHAWWSSSALCPGGVSRVPTSTFN